MASQQSRTEANPNSWTDERDELLLDKIKHYNALETRKMGERFQQIADDLFSLESFKNFTVVKGGNFQKRYTEMMKDALKRWAIDDR